MFELYNMNKRFDVVICGGGLVGLTLGVALGQYGVETAIIDSIPLDNYLSKEFDGRASSIALGSKNLLDTIGVWSNIKSQAQPILQIRVSDGNAPFFPHYDHLDVGDDPLGWMVENRSLRQSLLQKIKEYPNIKQYVPISVKSVDFRNNFVIFNLSNGDKIESSLAVAADGRNSFMRQQAAIKVTEIPYKQTGIVCTVKHEYSHQGIAHERFLPSGPFAILPLANNCSSIVWTEKNSIAPKILNLKPQDFMNELRERFGNFLGRIDLVGSRWSYPLSLCHANNYVSRRLALIGDAAHSIHPIAGQGFNLGIRDCAILAEFIVENCRLGLDLGNDELLKKYQSYRRFDSVMMIAVTHGLNHLFSNHSGALQVVRGMGLSAVNQAPPIKRFFMRHAMGLVGDLPRLVRGEQI